MGSSSAEKTCSTNESSNTKRVCTVNVPRESNEKEQQQTEKSSLALQKNRRSFWESKCVATRLRPLGYTSSKLFSYLDIRRSAPMSAKKSWSHYFFPSATLDLDYTWKLGARASGCKQRKGQFIIKLHFAEDWWRFTANDGFERTWLRAHS